MTGRYYLQSGTVVIINEGQRIHVELVSEEAMDFEGNKVGEGLKNLTYKHKENQGLNNPEVERVGPVMKIGNKEQLRYGGLIEAT